VTTATQKQPPPKWAKVFGSVVLAVMGGIGVGSTQD
jgi:hypothetical protein